MRERKKWKRTGAFVVAAVLSVSVFSGVRAASAVDTKRMCSVTFSVSEEQFPEFVEESTEMEVKLYRVADVTATGGFTLRDKFESVKIPEPDSGSDQTSVWAESAAEAYRIITEEELEPVKTVKISGAQGSISDLATGLYLVAGETAQSSGRVYEFVPYLVSLPYNYYQPGDPGSSDAWMYDITQSPKLEQTDRYGRLIIRKELDRYNMALGPVSFVFLVEAVRGGDAEGTAGEMVYSNVAALTFDGVGEKSVEIPGIPANTEVTVTELPLSGSYDPVSGNTRRITIPADEVRTVSFENDYNNGMIGSFAVVNEFTNTDGEGNWRWDQRIGDQIVRTEGGLNDEEESE